MKRTKLLSVFFSVFFLMISATLIIAEPVTDTIIEPVLEPAAPKPPPSAPPVLPDPDPVPAASAVPPASSSGDALRRYQTLSDIPVAQTDPAGNAAYLLFGTAERPADLLYRLNKLPAYLPLLIYYSAGEKVYRVYAGPLSAQEKPFLEERRDYLWQR